jgi:hypothetical protein
MSGLIRSHFLSAGASLDRRRLQELLQEAAKRMSTVGPDSIGLGQLARTKFSGNSFEEMWYSYDSNLHHLFPDQAHHVSGTSIELRNDDSYLLARVAWSLACKATTSTSIMLTAWPVIDGESLWAGQDTAIRHSVLTYVATVSAPTETSPGEPFTNGAKFSLGGLCNAVGGNGRYMTGILMFSIGAFMIEKSQLIIKGVGR